jgi:hypothetical protein
MYVRITFASVLISSLLVISCTTSDDRVSAPSDPLNPQNNTQMSDASRSAQEQTQSTDALQGRRDSGVASSTDSSNPVKNDPGKKTDAALTDARTTPDSSTPRRADASVASDSGKPLEPCNRTCLVQFLGEYLDALVVNDPSKIKVAPKLRATENGQEIRPGEGVWATATALRSFREDFVDVVKGQAGSFVVFEENGAPALLTLRLKIVNRQITEIETIVSRTGAHMFFAPDNLVSADPIFEEIVPAAQRTSRKDLERLANVYFDALGGDGSMLVFDPQCRRLENGVVAASGTGIGRGLSAFTYIEEVKRRIPIVDEERGLAFGLAMFEIPSQSRSTFVAELFKITDSSFQMIHAFLLNAPYGTSSGW